MEAQKSLRVEIFSFGFKYGPPIDINFVFDVRSLPNPYWVKELRPRTGKETEVSAYVLESDAGKEYLSYLQPLLLFLVKQHRAAEKGGVRIGIGCTGGMHRSVAVTEAVARQLKPLVDELHISHRDITKDK
jgi:UPF0042 nucleotide-binding protein